MQTFPEILLILYIINLGTAFGAGFYETRIVLPLWFNKTSAGYTVNTDAMRNIETGRKFWGGVTTIPLTLLTIANLVVAWQSFPPAQSWWLAAAGITVVERLCTFTFFIPTALKLQKAETMPAAEVNSKVSLWVSLNSLRNLFTLFALVAALKALVLM